MSERADIAKGRLTYTCQCGWIDLGHALPGNAQKLWHALNSPSEFSFNQGWFKVRFEESMRRSIARWTEGDDFAVQRGLSSAQLESVGLAILLDISRRFEAVQAVIPDRISDSGFSAEDLVSNVISYYRAVRPMTPDYVDRCGPVSNAAAEKVWDTYGSVGSHKNRSADPILFPCSECSNQLSGPTKSKLPSFLSAIVPAREGTDYKKWRFWDADLYRSRPRSRTPGPTGQGY
jgi:hypothetical protein